MKDRYKPYSDSYVTEAGRDKSKIFNRWLAANENKTLQDVVVEFASCAAGPWHPWPEEKPEKADEYLVYNHKGFRLTFDSYDPTEETWAMLEDDVIAWAEVNMPEEK